MKHTTNRLALLIGGAALLATGVLRAESPQDENSIGRRLEGLEQASTFVTLLKNTDTSKHLLFSPKSTLTVFVPTNKAFDKLSDERRAALFDPANKHWLERVLAYHAVHGSSIDRYVLSRVGLVKNGVNQNLKVSGATIDDLHIDGIPITEADFTCSNGVVHFIDEVIEPVELDLFESIEQDGRFTVLSKLLKRSGLTKLLQNRHSKYTVFAPTDEAFKALPKGTVETLLAPQNLDLLSDVLRTHIVAETVTVGKIPGEAFPLGTRGSRVVNQYGQELVYRANAGARTIDGVPIASYDHLARNGIFHVIDRPLLPKRDSIRATLEQKGDYTIFLALMEIAGRLDTLDQFNITVTVFAPTDEALRREGFADRLDSLRSVEGGEMLRGILGRHIIDHRRLLLTNAIAFQRFESSLDQRLDIRRDGEERTVQGIPIVETDLIAANGIVHGIDGIIPNDMEAVDSDQNWRSIRRYLLETLTAGSRLYGEGRFEAATDYYEARSFEFQARFGASLESFYGVKAASLLYKNAARNRHYDFANTAWDQRNGFRDVLRGLEKARALLIDEDDPMMTVGRK
ncbi:MAG: fasciclin domain-containing protein [Akkermansiaceae bacterium]|nr:fasciclin domain-containing protein [Akkermansiaceae bacterium]NNM30143.1 fasciclin domain-containing protein [Akkermansiaceae bacterium]